MKFVMNSSQPSGASSRSTTAARAAWAVLIACGLIALSWFLLSNRGAGVARDLPAPPVVVAAPVASEAPVADIMRDHLAMLGLQMADHDLAARLFNDPRRERELVVFVDARDGVHYESGHIPGAYRLESSELARDLPVLLPVCLTAETVVVYCNGGDCNDSETAAPHAARYRRGRRQAVCLSRRHRRMATPRTTCGSRRASNRQLGRQTVKMQRLDSLNGSSRYPVRMLGDGGRV